MRGWKTNSERVRSCINDEVENPSEKVVSVLGLTWNTCDDVFETDFDDIVKKVNVTPPLGEVY